MKRLIKSSTQLTYKNDYTDHLVYTWGKQKYSVYFKWSDDPEYFQCQVSEIHPYDDAKYAWARKDSPAGASIYRDRKLIDSVPVKDFDEDEYEDPSEYINDVIFELCQILRAKNASVEPRIIHN